MEDPEEKLVNNGSFKRSHSVQNNINGSSYNTKRRNYSPIYFEKRDGDSSDDDDDDDDGDWDDSYISEWIKPLPQDRSLEDKLFTKGEAFAERIVRQDLDDNTPVEITGTNIPPPITSYDDLNFTNIIRMNLKLAMYVYPTLIQRHIMPVILAKRDLMVYIRHGTGTLASFIVPILHQILVNGPKKLNMSCDTEMKRYPLAVFVAASHVQATHIYEECHRFSYRSKVRCYMIHSDADTMIQFRGYRSTYHILITEAPCLGELINAGAIGFDNCKHLVMKGIDKMLQYGFREQVFLILGRYSQHLNTKRQTIIMSTTLPREIQWLAEEFLKHFVFLKVGYVNVPRCDVIQKVVPVEEEQKRSFLINVLMAANLREYRGKDALTLVFVEKKKDVDLLDVLLTRNGFPVTSVHGERGHREREESLKLFRSGHCPILIGTLMAIRKSELPPVTHVILYDMVPDIEKYSYCLSYTGHPDKVGLATSFFNDNVKNITSLVPELVDMLKASQQEVPMCLRQMCAS